MSAGRQSLWVAVVFGVCAGAAALLRCFLIVIGAEIAHWYSLSGTFTLLALLSTFPTLVRLPRWLALAESTLFLIVMFAVGAPWTSRDRFLADFEQIHAGMTEPEVEARLGKYLKGTGISNLPGTIEIHDGHQRSRNDVTAGQLSAAGCQTYRHSTDGLWNADWGTVCYSDGRVTTKSFSPD